MTSKPVYFKRKKMWICCITVHLVSDQISDNRLCFFFFFFSLVIITPGLKKQISFPWKMGGKQNACTSDLFFCLKPSSSFLDNRESVHAVLLDVEAMKWRSLCLYALISHPCVWVCVCVFFYERVTRLVPVNLIYWGSTSAQHFLPPPAPPQALNVSSALSFISHVSILYKPLFYFLFFS